MKLAVLGTGYWGTTLAWLLSNNFEEVALWGRNLDKPLCTELDKKVLLLKYLLKMEGKDIAGLCM